MTIKIVINGRLANRKIIGVSRYTREITTRWEDQFRLLSPSGIFQKFNGTLWEQLYLPFNLDQNYLLWSPANSGPILVDNQVITIHDVIPFEHPEWFSRAFSAYYQIISPRIAKNAKKIITDSNFSKSRITHKFNIPDGKVSVIPLGVGDEFKPLPEKQTEFVINKYRISSPYFFVLGTIEPRKNISRLLQAWKIFYRKFPKYELIIAGIGISPSSKIKKLTIPDGVRLIGFIENKDLPAIYNGAKALLFPSIYEGFGLPILEAMACGTPVIASNTTSLPEVVGQAGLLINPYDVDDLAVAIERVVQDGELHEDLRQLGLERAKLFSWDRTAELTWQVLSQAYEEIFG